VVVTMVMITTRVMNDNGDDNGDEEIDDEA